MTDILIENGLVDSLRSTLLEHRLLVRLWVCRDLQNIDHCQVEVLYAPSGHNKWFIHAVTCEGEQPPLPVQTPKVDYLSSWGIEPSSLDGRVREWARRGQKDFSWGFWLKPRSAAVAFSGLENKLQMELFPSNPAVLGFIGVYEERFATYANTLNEIAEKSPTHNNRTLARDFGNLSEAFGQWCTAQRAVHINHLYGLDQEA